MLITEDVVLLEAASLMLRVLSASSTLCKACKAAMASSLLDVYIETISRRAFLFVAWGKKRYSIERGNIVRIACTYESQVLGHYIDVFSTLPLHLSLGRGRLALGA